MKTAKKMAAQGDVIFRKINALPSDAQHKPIEKQSAIVAHSETGHDHVAHGVDGHYSDPSDALRSFIVARGDVIVRHARPWDTHETLRLLADESRGETVWEIRRQREFTPEGWRIVAD